MDKLNANMDESAPINEMSDADTTFEPTIDELMDELIDDEQTLREEEEIAALENDNPLDEIATLKEESEMPLEQLLAKYSVMPPVAPPRKKSKKSSKKQAKTQLSKISSEEAVVDSSTIQDKQEGIALADREIEVVTQEEQKQEAEQANGKSVTDEVESLDVADSELDTQKQIEQKSTEKLKVRRSHLFELYPEQNFDSTIAAAQHQGVQIEALYSEDEDMDDIEEETDPDYVKKTIMVGSAFQAVIPGLSQYGDILPYENEDKLVWEPSQVSEAEVEDYLLKIREIKPTLTDEESTAASAEDKNAGGAANANKGPSVTTAAASAVADKQIEELSSTKQANSTENKTLTGDADASSVVKDNEQALHLLVQCGYDFKEALRRKKLNSVPLTGGTMSIWSEEECQKFEEGIQKFGKDFLKIRQNQVRTRTMRELVQFYYLWKKSERRDHNFANADTVDHMDIYLNEGEDYGSSSGSTPAVLTAASTLITGRKINGCSQNNFSIMTGSVASSGSGNASGVSQTSSPTKSGHSHNRKRTASDASNLNLLNSGCTNSSTSSLQSSK